jgi:hypothetical protein
MTKHLPSTPFVTLSEALSWLAFQDVRDKAALNSELAGNAFGHGFGSDIAKCKIVQAIDLLADAVSGGKINMRGKVVRTKNKDRAQLMITDIPPIDMQNFRLFDITIDGFRFGRGLLWLTDANKMYEYKPIPQGTPQSIFIAEVTVERSGLMRNFSAILTKISALKDGKLPKLSKDDFDKWVSTLTPEERSGSEQFLREKCNADHPSHRVVTAMTRSLCKGRQRGRKIIKP